jgi:phosphoglycerate dehydrogenase-like enzyme
MKKATFMKTPLVYVALSPKLMQELEFDAELPRLRAVAEVEIWNGPGNPPLDVMIDALQRAQVVITGWGTPALTPLAEWSPERFNVRLLNHSAGTVKYFVPAEAVAEFTIGAIIMGQRQAWLAATRMREGREHLPVSAQHEVRGSTIGVIGASAIGRRVMKLLAPLGAKLLLYDPYCSPDVAAAHGATLVDLHELMRQSDTVTLHAPVTPETLGMLGAAEFAAMKDGALFVNTARGRLIDHDALLHELQTGRISALLDVTDPTEPLPPDAPFFRLENCVVLPHMAATTVEARRRQSRMVVDDTLRFLAGEPLQYQVTRERWDTMA